MSSAPSRPPPRPLPAGRKVVPRERGKAAAQDRRGARGARRGAGAHHRARDRQRAAHPGARRGQDRRPTSSAISAAWRASSRARPCRSASMCCPTPAASRSASSAPSSRGTRRCMLGALKIAPALCAGNTMVMKAAEDAPLGVLLMAEICQEFLPPGVLNVLTGYGEECGGPLANHPDDRASSPSPARPRSARSSCAPPPSASCRCRSSSAARARRSSIPTPTRTGRSTASSPPCASPGRARAAPRARACSCTRTSSTAS